MAATADLKNGLIIKHDNRLQQVMELQRVKPDKDPALVRTKLKDVLAGKIVDKISSVDVKIETVNVDRRDMTYLYHDGNGYVFMDDKTFDQISILDAQMPEGAKFLLPETICQVSFHEGNVPFAEMPVPTGLKIEHTNPGLQGDRSIDGIKPVTMETGVEIQVPLLIGTDDVLKVDTHDDSYAFHANH